MTKLPSIAACLLLAAMPCFAVEPSATAPGATINYLESDGARMNAVKAFADNALKDAADRYHKPATPLLANGVDLETKEHLRWRMEGGAEPVISNLSSQQNFLRLLVGLTALTGEARYEKVARDNFAYYFAHYQEPSGLLQWGGHRFIDFETLKVAGPVDKALLHEMKSVLPFYEFMFKVDRQATERYISGFWQGHVSTEDGLMFDRHIAPDHAISFSWARESKSTDEVLMERTGLTFITTADDLIYSAAALAKLSKNEPAWRWAHRLARLYYKARNPQTQLGAYQFARIKKLAEESAAPRPQERYNSQYGDRATRQFGTLDGFEATESSVLFATPAHAVYVRHSLVLLSLAGMKQNQPNPYVDWVSSGLKAFAKYGYAPESNEFKPLLSNGRDMSGYKMERDGYFGKTGRELTRYKASGDHLLAFVRAYCAAPDEELWATIRSMGRGLRLGDLGNGRGEEIALALDRRNSDPKALFALLDLYKKSGRTEYLEGARSIGDNIVRQTFQNGYFVPVPAAKYANIDAIEPLALLALEATLRGKPELVPEYVGSSGVVHGEYLQKNGEIRTIVHNALFVGVDREVLQPEITTKTLPSAGTQLQSK